MLILNIECYTTLFYSEQGSCLYEISSYLLLSLTENLMATIWIRELEHFFHIENILAVEFPKRQHL